MQNPFIDMGQGASDEELVQLAQAGQRDALEKLIARHQPWIFNIVFRMLSNRSDAEDATQDILIRAINGLPNFRGQSRFRTWLYRIAVNHVLNLKKNKWSVSESICSFAHAAQGLQRVPDFDPPDPQSVPVPVELLVEETKISCVVGTLLCLDGRQRMAFILGVVFGASDEVGAEILEVTPVNFRQILSRARRDLYEYLQGNCSLVNPSNSCKCARKTRAFIQGGFVDPNNLKFTSEYRRKIREVALERAEEWMDASVALADGIYRDHPFYELPKADRVREALEKMSLGPPA